MTKQCQNPGHEGNGKGKLMIMKHKPKWEWWCHDCRMRKLDEEVRSARES